ncbi:unnamed protein product [Cuscuta campestris]|uniref:Uncharacterized protein n=1 Tax=Cuscuta campestris TaxID=132261 RepID=A0A484KQE6_9ASTE|nr:unnamed protein product [Cuscuta campestris]
MLHIKKYQWEQLRFYKFTYSFRLQTITLLRAMTLFSYYIHTTCFCEFKPDRIQVISLAWSSVIMLSRLMYDLHIPFG